MQDFSVVILKQTIAAAKRKSYFIVRRDYRLRKRCTVHGVCAISCDWGLRATISLLPSTCQTCHRKRNA